MERIRIYLGEIPACAGARRTLTRSHGKKSGIDKVTVSQFRKNLENNLETLRLELKRGTYQPKAEEESQEWDSLFRLIRRARKRYQTDNIVPDWDTIAQELANVKGGVNAYQ